ncbi:hypothetical protein PMIN01_06219 [Paraphaeosphaeria minitans]|uniref:Uncharacterized protein n=1 Tax=Paraphaeosphaeria minitans TaxID=565426 RepID=A0A9P6GJM6_9PLEO|nr:hypothetical protein PMIN01_06219 [Paraphaeosphaeria minitans]
MATSDAEYSSLPEMRDLVISFADIQVLKGLSITLSKLHRIVEPHLSSAVPLSLEGKPSVGLGRLSRTILARPGTTYQVRKRYINALSGMISPHRTLAHHILTQLRNLKYLHVHKNLLTGRRDYSSWLSLDGGGTCFILPAVVVSHGLTHPWRNLTQLILVLRLSRNSLQICFPDLESFIYITEVLECPARYTRNMLRKFAWIGILHHRTVERAAQSAVGPFFPKVRDLDIFAGKLVFSMLQRSISYRLSTYTATILEPLEPLLWAFDLTLPETLQNIRLPRAHSGKTCRMVMERIQEMHKQHIVRIRSPMLKSITVCTQSPTGPEDKALLHLILHAPFALSNKNKDKTALILIPTATTAVRLNPNQ